MRCSCIVLIFPFSTLQILWTARGAWNCSSHEKYKLLAHSLTVRMRKLDREQFVWASYKRSTGSYLSCEVCTPHAYAFAQGQLEASTHTLLTTRTWCMAATQQHHSYVTSAWNLCKSWKYFTTHLPYAGQSYDPFSTMSLADQGSCKTHLYYHQDAAASCLQLSMGLTTYTGQPLYKSTLLGVNPRVGVMTKAIAVSDL